MPERTVLQTHHADARSIWRLNRDCQSTASAIHQVGASVTQDEVSRGDGGKYRNVFSFQPNLLALTLALIHRKYTLLDMSEYFPCLSLTHRTHIHHWTDHGFGAYSYHTSDVENVTMTENAINPSYPDRFGSLPPSQPTWKNPPREKTRLKEVLHRIKFTAPKLTRPMLTNASSCERLTYMSFHGWPSYIS
jgi:hypothetical protein